MDDPTLDQEDRPVLVRTREGLGVHDTALRLDPVRPAELAFVSSALHPKTRAGRHRRLVTSPLTLALLGLPTGAGALPAPIGRVFEMGRLTLELRPSGRLPGAVQLRAITQDAVELCYVGVWRPDGTGITAAGEVVPCDVLVFEVQHLPDRAGPTRLSSVARLREAVAEAERAGRSPVLRAHPLRAAPEALAVLTDEDVPMRAHPRIREVARRLHDAGLPVAIPRGLSAVPAPGEVVLMPSDRADDEAPAAAGPAPAGPAPASPATAAAPTNLHLALPDEAGHPESALVPFCDVPDAGELARYAEQSGARRVLVFGAAAQAAVKALRARGLPAEALDGQEQLPLL